MAVTKTLTKAVPYNQDGKVQQWDLAMKYEKGADATYFTTTLSTTIPAVYPAGEPSDVNFIPKAEASWTLAELTALCPTNKWDKVFDSMYNTAITNPPPPPPVPDPDYVIPS